MRLDPDLIALQRRRDPGDDDAAAEQYERYDTFLNDAIDVLYGTDETVVLPEPLAVALRDWYRGTHEYRTEVAEIHAVLTARPDPEGL